jgi:hypothetical protein
MVIKITWPRGVTFDIRRLRSHANWYKGQVARFGPVYGSQRFTRRARERTKLNEHVSGRLNADASRIGSTL